MGVVAMNAATQERIDLTRHVEAGSLAWSVPAGTWKVMIFVCVRDGWDRVDYLNPEAVKRFIELTYERFYQRLRKALRHDDRQRVLRRADVLRGPGRPGVDRVVQPPLSGQARLQPGAVLPGALVRHRPGDRGRPQRPVRLSRRAVSAPASPRRSTTGAGPTASGSPATWTRRRSSTRPGLCGDLIKAFKYQDIPGIDQIFQYGRASKAYKVVSSAAANYDRPLVMTETYGAMEKLDPKGLYREAILRLRRRIAR